MPRAKGPRPPRPPRPADPETAGLAFLHGVLDLAEAERRRGTRFRRIGPTLLVVPPPGADDAAQERALAVGQLLDAATAVGALLAQRAREEPS